jgi:hypothetical protein
MTSSEREAVAGVALGVAAGVARCLVHAAARDSAVATALRSIYAGWC